MKVQRGEVTCPGSLSLHRGELRFEHEATSKTSALSTTSPGIPAKDPHLSSLCDPLQGSCPQSPDRSIPVLSNMIAIDHILLLSN